MILNYDNNNARRAVEHCFRTTSTMVNPIIDWSEDDVWEFLKHYGCRSNPLYECGKSRIGCIGCPMQSKQGQKRDFERYPKYKEMYIKAFDRMLEEIKKSPTCKLTSWNSGEEVMKWWLLEGDEYMNQMSFFEEDT